MPYAWPVFAAASRQSTLPRLCRCRAAMVSPWLSPECTLKRRARERAEPYSPERADLRCTKLGVKIAPRMAAEHACTAPIRRGPGCSQYCMWVISTSTGCSMHRSHSPKTLAGLLTVGQPVSPAAPSFARAQPPSRCMHQCRGPPADKSPSASAPCHSPKTNRTTSALLTVLGVPLGRNSQKSCLPTARRAQLTEMLLKIYRGRHSSSARSTPVGAFCCCSRGSAAQPL